jgi:predicted phage-related endonuclease
VDVILEKRGEADRPDLSGVEAVQMGLKMQPVIGRLFEEATGISVREYDLAVIHKTETWLKTHTDFTTGDGGLLEVKNYNGAYIKSFSGPDEPLQIPETDYIQLVHEATVFDVSHIYLAVLFGGQSFRDYRLDVTDTMKDEFIQKAAVWWAQCQNGEMPPAETTDQAKKLYRMTTDDAIVSNQSVEIACAALKEIKAQIKELESKEEQITVMLQNYMRDKTAIITPYNETLVTWKAAKESKSFDSKLFAQTMPDVYEKFVATKPGARRFLLK